MSEPNQSAVPPSAGQAPPPPRGYAAETSSPAPQGQHPAQPTAGPPQYTAVPQGFPASAQPSPGYGTAPGYGAAPRQPYGAPSGYGHPGATGAADGLGRVALVVSLVTFGAHLILMITSQFAIYSAVGSISVSSISAMVNSLISFLGGAVALGLGIAALRRKGVPHGAAGIATGIAGTLLANTVVTFLFNGIIVPALYSRY